MITGSMTQREYRTALLGQIMAAWSRRRRLERALQRPPLNRQFKNPHCESAKKLALRRAEVEEQLEEHLADLMEAWNALPETTHSVSAALMFAADLAKRERNPRFLKNQTSYLS